MLSTLFAVMSAMPYVVALLLGVLVPALGVLCYSNFVAGLVVTAGMFAIEAMWMNVGGLQLGIRIYYTDFVLVFIGAIALLRMLTARDTPRWHWAWGLYALAFVVSLGTGVVVNGSGAGVASRDYFYAIAAGSYATSFPIDQRSIKALLNALVTIAVLLLFVCAYRWVVYYTPITDLLPEGGVYNVDGAIRVIVSREALVVGQVFVVGMFFAKFGRAIAAARVLSPLTLACVLALQHRSVWLSILIGLMAGLFIARSRSGSKLGQMLLLLSIVTVTALPLALSSQLSGVTDQVEGSAARAVEGSGSVGERFQNWQGLLKLWAAGGPRSIVLGQSFGSDATRYVHDEHQGGEHKIEYAAHNHYVQTLYNMGLVGLLGFLAATTYAVRGLYRMCASEKGDAAAELLLTLLAMQLAYYVPYSSDYLQSFILGTAIAYVARHERAARLAEPIARPLMRRKLQWGRT